MKGAEMSDLYERDFYAWAGEQAALLRSGRLKDADILNIAEEIESMGRSEKRELVSRLTVLLLHLLKWRFQPDRRGASWETSVKVQRIRLAEHLADNPSLRPQLPEAISSAYRVARLEAAGETGLKPATFPASCPWSAAELLDEDYWPNG
jgi:hypothetical protein